MKIFNYANLLLYSLECIGKNLFKYFQLKLQYFSLESHYVLKYPDFLLLTQQSQKQHWLKYLYLTLYNKATLIKVSCSEQSYWQC